jgi:transitional endoplasmic reticulum ATPase
MAIDRRRRHLRANGCGSETADERFIWGKTAQYLQLHVERFGCRGSELLELACRVLGRVSLTLPQTLMASLGARSAARFAEELAEIDIYSDAIQGSLSTPSKGPKVPRALKCLTRDERREVEEMLSRPDDGSGETGDDRFAMESDLSDFAELLNRMVRKSGGKGAAQFRRRLTRLIERRIQGLKCRSRSGLQKNLKSFAEIFGLTEPEQELMLFLFIIKCHGPAEAFFDTHLKCGEFCGRKYLLNVLRIDNVELLEAIDKFDRLGIISTYSDGEISIEDDMTKYLQNSQGSLLTKHFYRRTPKRPLPLSDHFGVQGQARHALQLLGADTEHPLHILLYGPPGTGKTSFAYGLAARLKLPAYEVALGEDNEAKKRRTALLVCLRMTGSRTRSLVIVDEADNLLNTRSSWLFRGETQDKGWLNRIMEQPGARVIWITNSTDRIEDSVLRRFAFSVAFKPFTRRQRVQVWNNVLTHTRTSGCLTEDEIVRLAARYTVSAGVVDTAVRTALSVTGSASEDFLPSLELALRSHVALQNGGTEPAEKDTPDEDYSIEGLNTDADLKALIAQMQRLDELQRSSRNVPRNMNLLFYGPPGTGKSALARHLADRLQREVICKRVSDLQSKWVGQGEKNIARAFEEAEREEAVLVIDEADSVLFSRDRARHSWEISFTNEFLTRMEHFRGILICTTNRMKDLDEASIRRFNRKILFDYLTPEGNIVFYERILADLVVKPLGEPLKAALIRIPNLTPADFRNVRNRCFPDCSGLGDHKRFLAFLEEESRLKTVHLYKRMIGF